MTRNQASTGGLGMPAPRTLRSIETFSTRAPSGKSMPRKKMSLQPLWVRSMRTGVVSRRMGNRPPVCCEQFGAEAQRIIGGMAGAEHPLIAAHGAHAAAHLSGEGLEAEAVIGGGQRAGDGGAGAVGGLRREEDLDGFFEAALQQVIVAAKGMRAWRADAGLEGQVEAVDGVEEKQGADAFVESCRWSGGTGRARRIRRAGRRARRRGKRRPASGCGARDRRR